MRFSGLMLIGALALGACGKETRPKLDENDLPRTAAEFVAVYNDWDTERMAALYGKKKPDMAREQAKLAWLHEHLGACDEPTLMWRKKDTRARFSAQCERGQLEIAVKLDRKGQLKGTLNGAVGVAAPAPVEQAVREVLATMPWTKADAGLKPWSKAIKAKWIRELGRCEVAGVRSVTDSSGRFDLRCERGAALLRLEIAADGHYMVRLWPSNSDPTRAYQTKMIG